MGYEVNWWPSSWLQKTGRADTEHKKPTPLCRSWSPTQLSSNYRLRRASLLFLPGTVPVTLTVVDEGHWLTG